MITRFPLGQPSVTVMKPADLGERDDLSGAAGFNRSLSLLETQSGR
jgi:hypothetical protein